MLTKGSSKTLRKVDQRGMWDNQKAGFQEKSRKIILPPKRTYLSRRKRMDIKK